MLNKQEFNKIKEDLAKFDEEREAGITKSREIIRISKLIINSLHRNNIKDAELHIKEIKDRIKKLPKQNTEMSFVDVALQEYAEALLYYHFIIEKKIPTRKDLDIDTENYLLGMCDLTGELVRKAVNSAINKKYDEVMAIRELVTEIYAAFLEFNLRNNELRKKMDSIKYNLMKLENLVYEIKLKTN